MGSRLAEGLNGLYWTASNGKNVVVDAAYTRGGVVFVKTLVPPDMTIPQPRPESPRSWRCTGERGVFCVVSAS
ncbi:hypothetical protein Deipe_1499 [Deinococcus peraridilitoris DSM 19664]|uniref:Uncharacterized protein n=1 Tax=Deinococcus peraridilitoris (strain DSM 19664 / LMG 22246 / CIP 109416 / KR-200) TaxID=937777 RepID=L0A207_DEIPD|nr:hypothetical protein Deipe_1499 [Deinococcus peraridilitoris DSM 19664]